MTELSDAIKHDPELRPGRSKRKRSKTPRAPSSLGHWRKMKYAFARARKFVKPPDKLAIELDAAIDSLEITIRMWNERNT